MNVFQVPELMEFFKVYNRCFILIAANSGIALGYFVMLLIAIFEEHIEVWMMTLCTKPLCGTKSGKNLHV